MASRSINRRQFLGAAATLGSLAAAPGWTTASARAAGANERIRVVIIGPGDRGATLMGEFFNHAPGLNVELVGACDLWNRRRAAAAYSIKRASGRDAREFRNTDELYAAKDVDAVIIATPDFSHARLLAEAVGQGKDAYCEKPLAHTIEDARIAHQAVTGSGRVVQIGTQRRSDPKYRAAAEYLHSGQFGPVVMVEMHWNVNQPERWRRPPYVLLLRPQDTDWKRFLQALPPQPFDARKYVEFRLFWPFSSGIPDQWMSHQIDTVAWFTGVPFPRSVVANGGIYRCRDGRTNPDTFTAVFDYGTFGVQYHARLTNGAGGTREVYYSSRGSLDLQKGLISGDGGRALTRLADRKLPPLDRPRTGHLRNWLECLRTRQTPNAPIDAGYQHAVALSMAVRALHTGKRIGFDPAAGRLVES